MKRFAFIVTLTAAVMLGTYAAALAQPSAASAEGDEDVFFDPFAEEPDDAASDIGIADPLEPFNRAMFVFNDTLYFYFMKPVAQGYIFLVPEPGRKSLKRFFSNITTPARVVNCLFQGKFKAAGNEVARFCINTTMGVLGFFDPAAHRYGLKIFHEDLGQTLGSYGLGPGFYLYLPILGPSSTRDAAGAVGDFFLDPLAYAKIKLWERGAIRSFSAINSISLSLGIYEDLKKAAIDPYISLRNAYYQNRESVVGK